MPSDRMGLVAAGFSEGIAYDFDLAVMTLAGTIEGKARETRQVTKPNQPDPPKGSRYEQEPVYTMRDLLVEPDQREGSDGDVPDELTRLPTANL